MTCLLIFLSLKHSLNRDFLEVRFKNIKTANEIKQINSYYKTITIKFKKGCIVCIKAETDSIAVWIC